MRTWNCIQKTSDLPLNTEIIRQTHKIMMDGAGEYRKSPVFVGYHIFASASHIERYLEDAIFIFHQTHQICLETLSIYIHLKMEMEQFVA